MEHLGLDHGITKIMVLNTYDGAYAKNWQLIKTRLFMGRLFLVITYFEIDGKRSYLGGASNQHKN